MTGCAAVEDEEVDGVVVAGAETLPAKDRDKEGAWYMVLMDGPGGIYFPPVDLIIKCGGCFFEE